MPSSKKKIMKKLPPHLMVKIVLSNLYMLPLDVKNKIYKTCIDSHMVEWMKGHVKTLKPTISYFKKVDYARITEWRIQGLIPPASLPGFLGRIELGEYKEGEINPYLNSKVARPCHNKYIRGRGGYLKDNKIDQYVLRKDIIETTYPGVLEQISRREFYNSGGNYWVGKKCRCLTCDIIRLMYYKGCSEDRYVDSDITQRYCRTSYDPFEKKWTTETKSQLQVKRDAKRKQHRENMKRSKEISLL